MRALVLRDLSAIVAEAGGDAGSLLSTLGVELDLRNDEDSFIGSRVVERVLEAAANRFDILDLGLRLAARQDFRVLGPLSVAMENSHTVGEALDWANRFISVLSPALVQDVIPDPNNDPEIFGLRLSNSLGITSPQFLDYGIGMEHRVLMMLSRGRPYGLRSVLLPHQPIAGESVYRSHFGTEIDFDATDAVLRMPRTVLSMPVRGGDKLLRHIAVEFLEQHYERAQIPVTELVTTILKRNHGVDRPALSEVARALNLHERSLQRLLAAEGTRFAELLDDVRRVEARHLIENTDLSFSQIALRIGLREQSSLTHASRRWFGAPPSQLRKAPPESR